MSNFSRNLPRDLADHSKSFFSLFIDSLLFLWVFEYMFALCLPYRLYIFVVDVCLRISTTPFALSTLRTVCFGVVVLYDVSHEAILQDGCWITVYGCSHVETNVRLEVQSPMPQKIPVCIIKHGAIGHFINGAIGHVINGAVGHVINGAIGHIINGAIGQVS